MKRVHGDVVPTCVAVPTSMRIIRHEAGISRHEAHNCMRRHTSMHGRVCRHNSCMQEVQTQSCMQGGRGKLFFGKGGVDLAICVTGEMGAAGGAGAGVRTGASVWSSGR